MQKRVRSDRFDANNQAGMNVSMAMNHVMKR